MKHLFFNVETTLLLEFQRKHMCISMELVTAVLGDHGQRPREDYGKGWWWESKEIIF